jgi:glyoxylase-like metal-dependent hydrolase (beta-lactamase superfamily II)
MRITRCFIGSVGISLLALSVWAGSADDFEISINRLSERVALVQAGDSYNDTIIAVAGRDGLLVIDTGIAPSLTERYRKAIVETFGRSDFAYVVNTHYHFDHSDGNQVFADAVIVGHERCREEMLRFGERKTGFVARQRARVEGWQRQAAGLDPESGPALRLRDIEASYSLMCDDLDQNFVLTPPNLTFSDRLSLQLGDLTARLYYWGQGTHTGDDVLVHIPDEGLVATGDLFYPGGIQFAVQPGVDVDRQLGVLDAVLEGESVRHVVTVHNGIMSRDDLVIRRDYISALSKELTAARQRGDRFTDLRAGLTVSSTFPDLERLDIDPATLERQHQSNLINLWMELSGAEKAAPIIERTIRERGIATAGCRFREMLAEREERFFFDENGLLDEAIAVFRMNVVLYPDSWNVYDSLAESCMNRGDDELAVAYYEKSLDLNPDNENGFNMLRRLRTKS